MSLELLIFLILVLAWVGFMLFGAAQRSARSGGRSRLEIAAAERASHQAEVQIQRLAHDAMHRMVTAATGTHPRSCGCFMCSQATPRR